MARWNGTQAERFWARVRMSPDCWVWTGRRDALGYGRIYYKGVASTLAHRYAWEVLNGPIISGKTICHICDNPSCVRPSHLFLGTQLDNILDRDRKGRVASGDRAGRRTHPEAYEARQVRGIRHPLARLTDDAVREIHALRTGGMTQATIAKQMGVSKTLVWNILNGRNWAHVMQPHQELQSLGSPPP